MIITKIDVISKQISLIPNKGEDSLTDNFPGIGKPWADFK